MGGNLGICFFREIQNDLVSPDRNSHILALSLFLVFGHHNNSLQTQKSTSRVQTADAYCFVVLFYSGFFVKQFTASPAAPHTWRDLPPESSAWPWLSQQRGLCYPLSFG